MNCDPTIPPFIQTECREIPNRMESIRIYKRIPRKLKKKLKAEIRKKNAFEICRMAANAACAAISAIYGIPNKTLADYPSITIYPK